MSRQSGRQSLGLLLRVRPQINAHLPHTPDNTCIPSPPPTGPENVDKPYPPGSVPAHHCGIQVPPCGAATSPHTAHMHVISGRIHSRGKVVVRGRTAPIDPLSRFSIVYEWRSTVGSSRDLLLVSFIS